MRSHGENTIARGRASVRMYRDPGHGTAVAGARRAKQLSIRELIIAATARQSFSGTPAGVTPSRRSSCPVRPVPG
jgi:hypothetical protein